MKLTIDVEGDVQIERQLIRFGKRAIDAKPAFAAIAEALLKIEERQFNSQGGTGSGGWAPLSIATLKGKKDQRILHDTLDLRNSLTRRSDSNLKLIITDSFMVFGSKLEYAKYHQLGTSKMPQRRPVELTGTERTALTKILQRFIISGETF